MFDQKPLIRTGDLLDEYDSIRRKPNELLEVFAHAQRLITVEAEYRKHKLQVYDGEVETIKFLKLQHESVGYLLSAHLHRQVKQMEYWGLTELTTQLWQVDDTIFMLFKSQPPIYAGIWASCNSTGSRSKL